MCSSSLHVKRQHFVQKIVSSPVPFFPDIVVYLSFFSGISPHWATYVNCKTKKLSKIVRKSSWTCFSRVRTPPLDHTRAHISYVTFRHESNIRQRWVRAHIRQTNLMDWSAYAMKTNDYESIGAYPGCNIIFSPHRVCDKSFGWMIQINMQYASNRYQLYRIARVTISLFHSCSNLVDVGNCYDTLIVSTTEWHLLKICSIRPLLSPRHAPFDSFISFIVASACGGNSLKLPNTYRNRKHYFIIFMLIFAFLVLWQTQTLGDPFNSLHSFFRLQCEMAQRPIVRERPAEFCLHFCKRHK